METVIFASAWVLFVVAVINLLLTAVTLYTFAKHPLASLMHYTGNKFLDFVVTPVYITGFTTYFLS